VRERGDRFDAVIVGGGHNGLTAAAYLARAGASCLLLERATELGGAARSERIFPGVDANVSRYAYLVSLLPEKIVDDLALDVRLVRRAVSSYTPDPRTGARTGLLVGDDEMTTRASFAAVTGDERAYDGWCRLYAQTRALAQRAFPTMTEPLLPRAEFIERIGRRAWEMFFEQPLGDTIASLLADDLVAGVALTDALIGTFACARDESLAQNRCFLYHVIGRGSGDWLVPVGGMGHVTRALAQAARAAGAELRTGANVVAIDPDGDGAAVAFECGGGRREVGARRVLVNAAPAVLEQLLGADGSVAPVEGAQLKVNMVLSRLPRLRDEAVDPRAAFAGTFHVNEGACQLQAAFEAARDGRMPDPVPCEVYCHSLTDRSILGDAESRAGVQTLTLFALHMPARLFRADPAGAREQALRGVLDSLNGVLAEPIEDCVLEAPDGSACIEACSPLDLERELALPGGNIFHRPLQWPYAEDDADAGTWGVKTGHPAILLCGAGARRGGGVSGIAGHNAAMAALAGSAGPAGPAEPGHAARRAR